MNRVFSAGWRVFFWAAGLWAVAAMAVWLFWLATQASGGDAILNLPMAAQGWHAHEMIFGFAAAALGGFFLTAVPNWTGAKAAPERFIALVAGLWLAGRLVIWFSAILPPWLVAVVDLAFLPVLGAKILTQLLARPKPQNMLFLLLLSMVWAGNLMVHLDWMGLAQTGWQGTRGGLLAVCAMIAVLGGRVTPAFTRNAMLREGREDRLPVSHAPLDRAGIVLSIVTPLAVLAALPDAWAGVLALVTGLVAAARLAGWRGLALPGQPIVWALHLGYGMLALGLILWGLAGLGIGSEIGGLHVLAIGAVGGMTLAVMSRATIGHSGRELVAPGPVALAYGLMPLAVVLRWCAAEWPGMMYYTGTIASGLIWIAAFALYLVALWPIWFAPRAGQGGA
ncbi:MAG: NnrS family protein [Paracoccus sp. (in: a-proteobacteria)]|uniref:NnrS family protein n=1 Tax=Paracoccus sp. TaxID=267 RepID=UPI0026DEF143|nr:NnrS family protein [Paracoccus sp. (in: a-proteobacteria)]MDO5620856.1 NnrS family protein [Paracoccus sp. (in: a-proteobacteria)]